MLGKQLLGKRDEQSVEAVAIMSFTEIGVEVRALLRNKET